MLDEPTIGLHHTDLARLLDAIAGLPGPVVMVEHDRTAIAVADDVIEIGPGGGQAGGRLVFQGPPAAVEGGHAVGPQLLDRRPHHPHPARTRDRGDPHRRGERTQPDRLRLRGPARPATVVTGPRAPARRRCCATFSSPR